jgi:hypothetical protein
MRLLAAVLGLPFALALFVAGAPASATTVLFWEDFDGYSHFPNREPWWDPINRGLPELSEGANELWFGARFEKPDSACSDGTVRCDLAVQRFGGWDNWSRVGRFADDAGLLFSVDTTGFAQVLLSFEWRTFLADSGDNLVAGFFVGDIPLSVFGADRTADLLTGPYAWSNWVQLVSEGSHNRFTDHSFALPANVGTVWVALWLDNGNHDYGKVDDVKVVGKGMAPPPVPEPSLLALFGLAGGAIALRERRRQDSRTS